MWVYVSVPTGLLLMFLTYKYSKDPEPEVEKPKEKHKSEEGEEEEKGDPQPDEWLFVIINVLAVLGSLTWTFLVSGILIDLLSFLGMLTGLSKTYLGLTVIACGNALPDGIGTIAFAKQGSH